MPGRQPPGVVGKKAEFAPWEDTATPSSPSCRSNSRIQSERGDEITLKSAPFRIVELEGGSGMLPDLLTIGGSVLRYALVLVALVLFARLVVKPITTAWTTAASQLPLTASALERRLAGGAGIGEAAPPLAVSISEVARAHTDESVTALRGWLNQR